MLHFFLEKDGKKSWNMRAYKFFGPYKKVRNVVRVWRGLFNPHTSLARTRLTTYILLFDLKKLWPDECKAAGPAAAPLQRKINVAHVPVLLKQRQKVVSICPANKNPYVKSSVLDPSAYALEQESVCWEQCSVSVTFWYGSLDLYTGLRIRIWLRIRLLLFSSEAFKMPTKKCFKSFFAYSYCRCI